MANGDLIPSEEGAHPKRPRDVLVPLSIVLSLLTGTGATWAGLTRSHGGDAGSEVVELRQQVKDLRKDVDALKQEQHDREQREKTLREVEARIRDLGRPGRLP